MSSLWSSRGNGSGRIDWSKVILVFVTIPCVLALVVGGYLYSARSVAVERAYQKAILQQTASRLALEHSQELEDRKENIQRVEDSLTGDQSTIISPNDADHTSITNSNRPHIQHTDFSEQHGNIPTTRPSDGLLKIGVILLVSVIASLFWIGRRKPILAAAITASVLAVGGAGMFMALRQTDVESGSPRHVTREVPPMQDVSTTGLIPLDSEQDFLMGEPLKIHEANWEMGHQLSSKTLQQIPDWVAAAKGENLVNPAQNEIILTSKRYSTVEEAESQLQTLAISLVSDYMIQNHPEMRATQVSQQTFERAGIIDRKCIISWPFQVGEFTDEMQQVAWKLKIDQSIQDKLYKKWRNDERVDRLAILGGGLGGMTLLLGTGAMITRRREQHQLATHSADQA